MNLIKDYNIKLNSFISDNIKFKQNSDKVSSPIRISDDSNKENHCTKENLNSQTNNNIIMNNEFNDGFFDEEDNNIFMYYSSSIEYLKKNEKLFNILNLDVYSSNNFVPKNKNNIIHSDEQLKSEIGNNENKILNHNIENKKMSKNINYNNYLKKINKNINYNNYLLNQNKTFDYQKNITSTGITKTNNNFNNIINNIDCNINSNIYNSNNFKNIINLSPFIPSKLKVKIQPQNEPNNTLLKEININNEEIPSIDDRASPHISEITNKDKNSFSSNEFGNINDTNLDLDESQYLVEMFGKKGWICILCNNFNYNIRVKCNRCGHIKKPKRISDMKINLENNKEKNNMKGDWLCPNCKNINYSFRTFCNRCRCNKINLFLQNLNTFQNINFFNNNYSSYYSFPTFIMVNNIPSIYINNLQNIKSTYK